VAPAEIAQASSHPAPSWAFQDRQVSIADAAATRRAPPWRGRQLAFLSSLLKASRPGSVPQLLHAQLHVKVGQAKEKKMKDATYRVGFPDLKKEAGC